MSDITLSQIIRNKLESKSSKEKDYWHNLAIAKYRELKDKSKKIM